MTARRLPPPPGAPKRVLTPPARRAVASGSFRIDDDTPAKNETLAVFQALLSVFDPLPMADKLELVEFVRVYSLLTKERRAKLLEELAAEWLR